MCGIFFYKGKAFKSQDVENIVAHLNHRGPDNTTIKTKGDMTMIFWRLRINDVSEAGDQPFISEDDNYFLICNGEIYNHHNLGQDDVCKSHSDCEALFHLLKNSSQRHKVPELLDGVFAYIFYDDINQEVFVGRDPFGVRGLFQLSFSYNGEIEKMFASEMKMLYPFYSQLKKMDNVKNIELTPFEPSSCYQFQFGTTYHYHYKYHYLPDIDNEKDISPYYQNFLTEDEIKNAISHLFEEAVKKRLVMSEREVGCFLSGGLDSSLVAGYAMKIRKEMGLTTPFHTFSIGFPNSPDLFYAKKVAEHIGSKHHEVIVTKEDVLSVLPEIVRVGETVDITTIRASAWMYLLSRYIKQNTNVVVILSGEGSDELCQGYLYFKKAPDAKEASNESHRLLKNLVYYDVLRADRMTAAHGLEVRVPFLDKAFTSFYLSTPYEMRYVRNGIEKYLLRSAFSGKNIIPDEIIWRQKEAFSDGVSLQTESWHSIIQNYVYQFRDLLSDVVIQDKGPQPDSDEAKFIYYHYLKNYGDYSIYLNCPDYWLPKWVEFKDGVKDPSARTIDVYENSKIKE